MDLPRDKIFIKDLQLECLIGVNPEERLAKQNIIINLTVYFDVKECARTDNLELTIDYGEVAKSIKRYCECSQHFTLEALSSNILRILFKEFPRLQEVTIRVDKPSALPLSKSSAIEITRTKHFFLEENKRSSKEKDIQRIDFQGENEHIIYLALGSNIGRRVKNLQAAIYSLENSIPEFCKLLNASKYSKSNKENCKDYVLENGNGKTKKEKDPNQSNSDRDLSSSFVRLIETSFLYETPAAFLREQPPFLNAVCCVATDLEPHALLKYTQMIEKKLGRQPRIRFGPREIDIDILFYDDIDLKDLELQIPHYGIVDRDFVLGPLMDIAPDFMHPILKRTVKELFSQLTTVSLQKVLPIAGENLFPLKSRTFIMGILNVTPDSFSDGGLYNQIEKAVEHAKEMSNSGADIIDVGGQSTRPGSERISVEEELSRIIPVIRAIRQSLSIVPISVDTFYSKVAKEAIENGANIVNDISGGTLDPEMLSVCAKMQIPMVLMHMRGDPKTMNSFENYDDLLAEVKLELKERATLAESKGIYKWNIILDPGIGFSKNVEQNLELLRKSGQLMSLQYPLMLGPSRKRFIGKITGQSEPSERLLGTAATCTAAIQQGADILRIHDVSKLRDAILMSDAIYRGVHS